MMLFGYALCFIVENYVSNSNLSFMSEVKLMLLAVSVVFVTPLTGIVWQPSFLSAEGFEPVTLVSTSPPIYPDPSRPMLLSFSLVSPSIPPSFSRFLSLKGTVFRSVASPEQISALKCLLRLVSLTLLIILHSHDNSPLVSHLEFISFFSSQSLSTSQKTKKSSEARAISLF